MFYLGRVPTVVEEREISKRLAVFVIDNWAMQTARRNRQTLAPAFGHHDELLSCRRALRYVRLMRGHYCKFPTVKSCKECSPKKTKLPHMVACCE